jgi:ATP-binding cassette, subfamily B, bacterial PglK
VSLIVDIWRVLTSRQRRWVVFAQLISVVMAFSTVAGIASIAPFFSVLGNPDIIERSSLLHYVYSQGFASRRSFTVALGIAFMGLVLLANVINLLGTFLLNRLALWIGTDLQAILFAEYLRRPYQFHARTPSAVLFNNVVNETIRATNQILQNGFMLITNIVTAVFIIGSVMVLNPLVATAMIFALAGGYVLIYLAVRNRLLRAGQTQSRLFTEQTRIVNETLGAIKEILVLGHQQFFQDHFNSASRAFARAIAQTQLIGQSPRFVMECVAVIGLVGVALLSQVGGAGIGPSLGQLTFLGFAAYRLLPTLQQAFVALVRIRSDRPGFTAIERDLTLARQRQLPTRVHESSWKGLPLSEIRAASVSFRYEIDRPVALNGISVRIPARAAVGLVGMNGSGKTTLVDVLAGLLVPEQGHVEVDGVVLTDRNRSVWQSCIAYVPQNVFLLNRTLAENITLGAKPTEVNRERLLRAAQLAQLDELIQTLPGGYDHVIGERGVGLSGGQRQRIGIARALYTDASVLILDEATNALDGLTEQELLATIARLRGQLTIILIAHRLSTVRGCDLIYQLEDGRVAATGTYDALLSHSETFRRLVNA